MEDQPTDESASKAIRALQALLPAERTDDQASVARVGDDGVLILALMEFDAWLTSRRNLPESLEALDDKIAALFSTVLPGTAAWTSVREQFETSLYVGLAVCVVQVNMTLARVMGLATRFLLLMALVQTRQETPEKIDRADAVFEALRWRSLVLPSAVTQRLVEIRAKNRVTGTFTVGFTDLYVVSDHWKSYEPGEIAYIENVLSGESKDRIERLLTEDRLTVTTDTSLATSTTSDTVTTDSSQLQDHTTRDLSLAAHIDGQVDTAGQYGPTQVTTHVGGAVDFSSASSESRAITQAHETVARAVKQVTQTTREIRSRTTLTRSTSTQRHKLDNAAGQKPVVGIYRWVEQVRTVKLRRYNNRMTLEFEVPEPGAWLRWARMGQHDPRIPDPPPRPFTLNGQEGEPPLTIDQITPITFRVIAARYQVSVDSPPPDHLVLGTSITSPASGEQPGNAAKFRFGTDATLVAPDGYAAEKWSGSVAVAYGEADPAVARAFVWVMVGTDAPLVLASTDAIQHVIRTIPEKEFDTPMEGKVPVAVIAGNCHGFQLSVVVHFKATGAPFERWQQETYDRIHAAYLEQLRSYRAQVAALQDLDRSPLTVPDAMADAVIKRHLKRQVIELMFGQRFNGFIAIDWDGTSASEPSQNLGLAALVAPFIQFVEQAFEWELLSYICYPYFWTDRRRWKELALLPGSGAQMDEFLRAGSARVVISARPGFEQQAALYAHLGIVWGGGPAPAPGMPDYLSVADEIRDLQKDELDSTLVEQWEVTVPTPLVWLENPAGLPSSDID